jgi:hypothetical protein
LYRYTLSFASTSLGEDVVVWEGICYCNRALKACMLSHALYINVVWTIYLRRDSGYLA